MRQIAPKFLKLNPPEMNYGSEAYGVRVGTFMSLQPTFLNHGKMTRQEDKNYIRVLDTPNDKRMNSCRKLPHEFLLCLCHPDPPCFW